MQGTTVDPFGGNFVPDPLAQFLSRVVPWSMTTPPEGYVNIHYDFPPRRGVPGRAYASLDEYTALRGFIDWLNSRGSNLYFCIASVTDFETIDKGNRKARRKGAQARLSRSFVLDLDVKRGAYASQKEALAAVLPWLDKMGLKAGFITSSGNGIHVYIVLDQPIGPELWRPVASQLAAAAEAAGLHADFKVTRNMVSLVRLPHGKNWKDPKDPKDCRVLSTGPDMTLAALQAAVAAYPVTSGVSTPVAAQPGMVLDPAVFPRRPPITYGPEFARVSADAERNRVVTSVDLLRGACPVVRDSEARGGDGDIEPLWFELAKLCHYIEDGRAYFHRLSDQDVRYEHDATDKKFDEVQRAGWPQCATIAAASTAASAICKGCAFYGKGQSPINYATRGLLGTTGAAMPMQATMAPIQAPYINGASAFQTTPITSNIWMPADYVHRTDGVITTLAGKPIFDNPIRKMQMHYTPDTHIMFEFELGTTDNRVGTVDFPLSALASQATARATLFKPGLTFRDFNMMNTFTLDWTSQVRSALGASSNPRIGWIITNGVVEGFAFGGHTFTAAGAQAVSTIRTDNDMLPTGTLAEWKKAANYFVGRGFVEMEVIMASAFAAPLVNFTSVEGLILFARSSQSETGKSAAMETSASVWFHRLRAVAGGTTDNAAIDRIMQMNNLPAYFDELSPNAQAARRFNQLVLDVSLGREKIRLNRSSQPMAQRTSRTMMVAAANASLTQIASTNDTNAQAARVMEIEVPKRFDLPPPSVTTPLKATLDANYGVAGMVYAEYLGKNHVAIAKTVSQVADHFQKVVGKHDGERFWLAGAATLYVGAKISKQLGLIDFDIMSMEKFLIAQLRRQRAAVADMATNADDPLIQLARVSQFLNSRINSWIISKDVPGHGFNRNSKRCDPLNADRWQHTREFVCRLAKVDSVLWVSEAQLKNWCEDKDYNFTHMRTILVKHKYCTRSRNKKSLGAGLAMNNQPSSEPLLEFDLRIPGNEIFLPLDDDGV